MSENAAGPATDSITLAQLKQFVKAFPKSKQSLPSDFQFSPPKSDTELDMEEVDEFFSLFDVSWIAQAKLEFNGVSAGVAWSTMSRDAQVELVDNFIDDLEKQSVARRLSALACLLYISQGAYDSSRPNELSQNIRKNNALLKECGLLLSYHQILHHAFDALCRTTALTPQNEPLVRNLCLEIEYALSLIFMLLFSCGFEGDPLIEEVSNLSPHLPKLLFDIVEHVNTCAWNVWLPVKKLLYLFWKVVLLLGGDFQAISQQKQFVRRLYGLPPSKFETNLKYAKATVHDLKRYLDETCKKYTGFMPDEHVAATPFYNLIASHDPFPLHLYTSPEQAPARPQNMQGFVGPSLIIDTPFAINEAVSVLKEHLFTSVSRIQIAQETKFEKANSAAIENSPPMEWLKPRSPLHEASLQGDDAKMHARIFGLEAMMPQLSEMSSYLVALLKILLAVSTNLPANSANAQQGSLIHTISQNLSGNSNQDSTMGTISLSQIANETIRNKEIVSKAISSVILLLLKQARVLHVLAFEYLCQFLVDANCLLLILKVLNQDMTLFLMRDEHKDLHFSQFIFDAKQSPASSTTDSHDGDTLEETTLTVDDDNDASNNVVADETLHKKQTQLHQRKSCRRNHFTIINLLRILQKLTKRKSQRIGILVQYKAATILKKVLKVDQRELSMYVAKVMKNLLPFMTRKWRQENMHVITLIYGTLRTDFRDNWLEFSDSSEAANDFAQKQEGTLRLLTNSYVLRSSREVNRKGTAKNAIISASGTLALGQEPLDEQARRGIMDEYDDIELDEVWKRNYEVWLEDEVFGSGGLDGNGDDTDGSAINMADLAVPLMHLLQTDEYHDIERRSSEEQEAELSSSFEQVVAADERKSLGGLGDGSARQSVEALSISVDDLVIEADKGDIEMEGNGLESHESPSLVLKVDEVDDLPEAGNLDAA